MRWPTSNLARSERVYLECIGGNDQDNFKVRFLDLY